MLDYEPEIVDPSDLEPLHVFLTADTEEQL
jgi:hypothetical protein